MPLYEVKLNRTGFATTTVMVSAKDHVTAAEVAGAEAGTIEFVDHRYEYFVGNVKKAPLTPESELTAKQLADTYASPDGNWGQHPKHPRNYWVEKVSNRATIQGYWDWVVQSIKDEAEEQGRVTV